MVNALSNVLAISSVEHSGGGSKSPGADEALDKRVTSVACEVLRVYHALKEFKELYNNDNLPSEFNENQHERTPYLSKMQQGFNSLKDRVTELGGTDSPITELFNKMVRVSESDEDGQGLVELDKGIDELIGEGNIIDSGVFRQHGIICITGELPPSSKPENLITEEELKEMNNFLYPEEGSIEINGKKLFTQSIKKSLEKILTFPEGRILFKNIVEKKGKLGIFEGDESALLVARKLIRIDNKPGVRYGYSVSEKREIGGMQIPTYITLAHELIHFQHVINKNFEQEVQCHEDENRWTNQEEYKTIGDPRKKLPEVSENSFLLHTFYHQRIFHVAPGRNISTFNEYILSEKIKNQNIMNPSDAIKFIKENEIRTIGEAYRLIAGFQGLWSTELANEILNIPAEKGFPINISFYRGIFTQAAIKGDLEIITRLITDFPEFICDLTPAEKTQIILFSIQNSDITTLLAKNNFHVGIFSKICDIVYQESTPDWQIEQLKQIIKHRILFEILDESIDIIRKATTIPSEIRALFDESEEKEIQPLD